MTAAAAARDHTHTVLEPLADWGRARRREVLATLTATGRDELAAVGHARGSLVHEHVLDLRYAGQAYELEVPAGPRPAEAFRRAHEQLYGYALEDRPIELVCLRARVRAGLGTRADGPRPRRRPAPAAARAGTRRAHLGGRWCRATLWRREQLRPGHALEGPAIVEEYSGTTLVPPGWHLRVAAGGHLELRPAS